LLSLQNITNIGKTGEKCKQSKAYTITFPNGDEYVVVGLKEFCRSCNAYTLHAPNLCQCANNKVNKHKGFKCRHYCESDASIQRWKSEFNQKYMQ
jgi:hypothetical protein